MYNEVMGVCDEHPPDSEEPPSNLAGQNSTKVANSEDNRHTIGNPVTTTELLCSIMLRRGNSFRICGIFDSFNDLHRDRSRDYLVCVDGDS